MPAVFNRLRCLLTCDSQVQWVVPSLLVHLLGQQAVGRHHHQGVGCLHGEHKVVVVVLARNIHKLKCTLHHATAINTSIIVGGGTRKYWGGDPYTRQSYILASLMLLAVDWPYPRSVASIDSNNISSVLLNVLNPKCLAAFDYKKPGTILWCGTKDHTEDVCGHPLIAVAIVCEKIHPDKLQSMPVHVREEPDFSC